MERALASPVRPHSWFQCPLPVVKLCLWGDESHSQKRSTKMYLQWIILTYVLDPHFPVPDVALDSQPGNRENCCPNPKCCFGEEGFFQFCISLWYSLLIFFFNLCAPRNFHQHTQCWELYPKSSLLSVWWNNTRKNTLFFCTYVSKYLGMYWTGSLGNFSFMTT